MNKWSKIGLAVGMGSATIASVHVINKIIFSASVSEKITGTKSMRTYNWKFGSMFYTVHGDGAPLLLIHDLTSASSSYEWKKVTASLSRHYTVYAIDLLGCGHSDKPNITYTTYMYTQLINDFIVNVINKKTSVIATGNAAPLTIMAAYNNPYLFSKIMLVNPQSLKNAMINPGKRDNIRRFMLNTPIIGTLLYNIFMSHHEIKEDFHQKTFNSSATISSDILNAYHENAHLYGASARFLYSSIVSHYTTASIAHAVSQLDNCIYIISGKHEVHAAEIKQEYLELNPAIETSTIDLAKHLPQLENPEDFVKTVKIFLS